jgi:hypothetical protein
MNKLITRGIGNGVSLLGSTTFATRYAEIPNGANKTSFIVIAAIAALAGYNFGTWYGSSIQRRAKVGFWLSVLVIPIAYFAYDVVMEIGWSGGLMVAGTLYLLFGALFFAIFFAFGTLQVNVFRDS